jgi:CubicO group peptidase (beta-lactamase class C family)
MRLDDNSNFSIETPVVTVATNAPGGVLGQWLVNGTSSPGTYSISSNPISNQLTTAHFLRHMSDFVRSGGSPGFPTDQPELASTTTTDYLLGFDCGTDPCGYNGANVAWTVGGLGPVAPSYDSVNFIVPQGVVEQVTGRPAAELIEDYFLTPMGLSDTTGRTTANSILNRAAWQHGNGGPSSRRFV